MTESHAVTVVVSTRDRAHLLPRLFEGLAAQDFRGFDVVVVDDGSEDATPEVLAELAEQAPFEVRVVRGEGRGPAVGRDIGWQLAAAPVIAFTDDDCVPAPAWLSAGLAAMGDRRAVVVGRTLPNPDQAHHEGPFSRSLVVLDAKHFQTCNILYRRADLEAVGGFDHGFDKPGGEDTDLALRVLGACGAEAVFAADALVHHDVRPSSLRASLREARRWTGVPRLLARHPSIRRGYLFKGLFWKRSHPRVLLAWAGVFGVAVSPWALAAVVPWVWFRTYRRRLSSNPLIAVGALPGAFLVDSTEVVTMIRGGLRERTLIL